MRVLFIIPVLARSLSDLRLLKKCLESLKKHEPLMLAHTLIVEEFASLGVQDTAGRYGVSYIQKHTEPGYAASINIGISHAVRNGYSHVVTINSDIEFVQPVLAPFMRAFRYGDIVGGTLFYPTGKIQAASWHYRSDMMPVEDEKYKLFNSAELYKKERYVGGITGALQGFSLKCGLYDDKFFLSYEDVWFCLNNILDGRKVFYTPSISAVHVESATRGKQLGPQELASFKRYEMLTKDLNGDFVNSIVAGYNEEYEKMGQEKRSGPEQG